jgi:hypothetical protein
MVLAANDMTVSGGTSLGAFGSFSAKGLTFFGVDVVTSSLHHEACCDQSDSRLSEGEFGTDRFAASL